MKTNKGFTLIELMVVILIIGILSAIALPEYTRSMEKARVAEALTIMDAIKKGVDVYVAENGFQNQELIGNNGVAKQLDINVENELDCSDGDLCSGKYFNFDSWCLANQWCRVRAYRKNNEYTLYMEKSAGDLKWSKWCDGDTETAGLICDMLYGQGWENDTDYFDDHD